MTLKHHQTEWDYHAIVHNIVDGDTIDLTVDLGFKVYHRVRVRVKDIDCPEIWRPSSKAELEHAREAKAFVEQEIPVGSEVTIRSFKPGAYSRWDAVIYYPGGVLADNLRAAGFQKRDSYE